MPRPMDRDGHPSPHRTGREVMPTFCTIVGGVSEQAIAGAREDGI